MLQHEWMVVDEGHNRIQTIAGIQNTISKMHLRSHADELPWDASWKLGKEFLCYAKPLLQQPSDWLVSDDL